MTNLASLFPAVSAFDTWVTDGKHLGERERSAKSLMWDIGDWWNRGEPYGERAQIVTAPDWTGPTYGTCREAGRVAAAWPASSRIDSLDFKHHQITTALPDTEAIPALHWCLETEPPRSTNDLKGLVKKRRRQQREAEFAEATKEAAAELGQKLYGVIYVDPPWRFEPYSRETGMDRAADNHYQTMTLDEIAALAPPAATDCVMFMWATVPMLPQAIDLLARWQFVYRSHFIWVKDKAGTGYWNRNQHELLLVGTRGNVPAPAPGTQYPSVISAQLGRHSAKPGHFAEMIEELFPNTPSVEMFARTPRLGWDVWGNEV